MPATKICPSCGSSLPTAPAGANRLTCPGCGTRLAVRARKPADSAAAAAPAETAPELPAVAPTSAAVVPAAPPRRDPRLILALAAGAFLAVLFLGLTLVVVLAVIFWPRGGAQIPPVVVVGPPEAPSPDLPPTKQPIDWAPGPPPAAPVQPSPHKVKEDPAPPELPSTPPDLKPTPMESPALPEPSAGDAVDKAVLKAVAYLKKQVDGDLAGDRYAGNKIGVMALAGLALLESGVPPDDSAVLKAAGVVRDKAATVQNTYEVSLCVWFLDRLREDKDEGLIRAPAMRLIEGQTKRGLWDYQCVKNCARRRPVIDTVRRAGPLGRPQAQGPR